MKLLQIRLLVNDFKKSVEFYKDLLGLPISWLEKV
ncbi:VOC family protein, partial [Bacillus velezensis]